MGDIVLIHEDKQPRLNWKLAIVEELIEGHNGLVRAANVRTSNIVTSRPIAKLNLLEVSSSQEMMQPCQEETEENSAASPVVATLEERPRREAARKALEQMSEWNKELCRPSEDVKN